jgi:hypothetical protein
MSYRLIVKDKEKHEMYGKDVKVAGVGEITGIETNVTVKDVIAKVKLNGILASNLGTDKIDVSGTTHNLIINESPELYTATGMSVEEAKKFFEIIYSFDGGTTFLTAPNFILELNKLRTKELNDLNFSNFKVAYKFTADGSAKYYSTEVSNDPDANPASTILVLETSKVTKTIDLNEYITKVGAVKLSGTTLDIKYADELNTLELLSLGVKIQ